MLIFCAVQSHVPLFGVSCPQWCPAALFVQHVRLCFQLNCLEVVAGMILHQQHPLQSPLSSILLHQHSDLICQLGMGAVQAVPREQLVHSHTCLPLLG